MPYRKRNYRKFSKKIVVKPKVNWSLARRTDSGFVSAPRADEAGYNGRVTTYSDKTLVSANTDTQEYVGMTKKIKHLKVEVTRSWLQGNDLLHQGLIKMKVYLMYLPQGVAWSGTNDTLTGIAQTLSQHPEWVLSEKTLNCNYKSDSSYVSNQSISCKLSKNLKSGDRIACIIATTYNKSVFGSTDMSGYAIPYNLEWSWAQTL